MRVKRAPRFWRIRGYDSMTRIHDATIPLGLITDNGLEDALRALTARAGLDLAEIVDAYAKRGTRRYRPLLEVSRDSKPYLTLSCGVNPYFTATVVDADGKPIPFGRPFDHASPAGGADSDADA